MRATTLPSGKALRLCAALILCLGVTASPVAAAQPPAAADSAVVMTWNQIAVSTITLPAASGGPGKLPPEAFLYFSFVHAAMYNAVVGITGEYELYRWNALGPKGASAQAAAAAAAHRVLKTYFGGVGNIGASLDASLAASLSQIGDGVPKAQGVRYGVQAADHIIAMRENDGRGAAVTVPAGTEAGQWRPTPPANLPFLAPWYGAIDPMLIDSTTQFDPGPPPAMGTSTYLEDFEEVRDFGALNSAARSTEQTQIARFFAEIPVGPLHASLRNLAADADLDIGDAARMFAAVELSSADALATVWHAKLEYLWWRPITAIRLADTDGNPNTAGISDWTPLITTPPYPEWPSGLCSVVSAISTVLDRTFGSVDLTIASPNWGTRSYTDKATLDAEAVSARVWSGIHFRSADEASIVIGTDVADFALDHYFSSTD